MSTPHTKNHHTNMQNNTNAHNDNGQEHMTNRKNNTTLKSKKWRPSWGWTSGCHGVWFADAVESQENAANAHCVCCGVLLDDENTAILPEKSNARSSKVGDMDVVDAVKLRDNAAYYLWKEFGIRLEDGWADDYSCGDDSTEGSCIPQELLFSPENYSPGGDCPEPFSTTVALMERVQRAGRELFVQFLEDLEREIITKEALTEVRKIRAKNSIKN